MGLNRGGMKMTLKTIEGDISIQQWAQICKVMKRHDLTESRAISILLKLGLKVYKELKKDLE